MLQWYLLYNTTHMINLETNHPGLKIKKIDKLIMSIGAVPEQ